MLPTIISTSLSIKITDKDSIETEYFFKQYKSEN